MTRTGNPPFGYDVFMQRLDAQRRAAVGRRRNSLRRSRDELDPGLRPRCRRRRQRSARLSRRPQSPWNRRHRHDGEPGRRATLGRATADKPGKGPKFLGNPKITATSDGFAVAGWINGNNLTFQKMDAAGHATVGPGRDYDHRAAGFDLLHGRSARGRRWFRDRLVRFRSGFYRTETPDGK